ncbi:MAG: LuxR family transcriptional regulator [Paracoccaceae bacterium]|jgi:LuxR family transcriptional regulator
MEKKDEIVRILTDLQAASPSGFAIAFHIRFTTPDFLFQTYPKAWIDRYSEQGMVMKDPIVRWGFSEVGAIRWSELEETDEAGIIAQSQNFGMNFGIASAIDENGSRSVAGFARHDREFTDDEIAYLESALAELHHLTAHKDGMSAELRNYLQELSVRFTHPRA